MGQMSVLEMTHMEQKRQPEVQNVKAHFPVKRGLFRRVDDWAAS